MACDYTKQEVEDIIVSVFRKIQKDNTITRSSRFGSGKEIDIDRFAKRLYCFAIKQSVDRVPDCIVKKLTPSKCEQATTVGEIVDAVCDELKL